MKLTTVVAGVLACLCLNVSGVALGKVKTKPKYLKGEATLKGGQTHVDFDDTPIDAEGKRPTASMVSVGKADKNYDFVKIRLRWHPEMVQSASAID